MAKNEALGMELRQIIGTDEKAGKIIEEAKARSKEIEAQTKEQKDKILNDAAQRRKAMEQQVVQEQADILAQRKAQAQQQFETSRSHIAKVVQNNREQWKKDIYARIIKNG